jgi:polysaccharide export outer membrane protein
VLPLFLQLLGAWRSGRFKCVIFHKVFLLTYGFWPAHTREFAMKNLLSNAMLFKTTARIALIGLLAGLMTACAGLTPTYPAAPAAAATPDYNYIVGPGDSLNIIVWRNPELSMNVPVRPDGKVTMPLVDELVAQGKTSVEIAREVEKVLGKLVRDPVVTVVVTGFVGPYSEQIRVVGEAAKPQALPYKQKMTLLDVMIAVGGLTDFADGNGASITRAAEGNKRYSVRIKDLIKRGDISANVEMKPGDVLIIPQGWF